MFEPSEEAPLVDRATAQLLLKAGELFLLVGQAVADLFALALEVALPPGAVPVVGLRPVAALALDLVVAEGPPVGAAVYVGHYSLAVLLALPELPLICHAVEDGLLALPVRLGKVPVALIGKELLLEILPVFVERPLPLELALAALALVVGSI